MPSEIKFIIVLLFSSAFIAACGTYLDMSMFVDDGGYDPYIYLIDVFWLCMVTWIAWDLGVKKKDVRLTIAGVGLIIVGFSVWDYVDLGFSNGLYAYTLEAILYSGMFILLSTNQAKSWYAVA